MARWKAAKAFVTIAGKFLPLLLRVQLFGAAAAVGLVVDYRDAST